MAKTLLQYVAELKEIHDKQSQLALQEQIVMHEIAKFDVGSNIRHIVTEHDARIQATTTTAPTWNTNLKIDKKTLAILKRTKRLMTNREVCEAIVEIEKNDDPEYLKFLIRKFSAVVGGRAKNARVFNRIDIDGDFYFGLVDWFYPDGSAKTEYRIVE